MSDMASAAARHKRCAGLLAKSKETAEACYLIGLAAECALKHHLGELGFNFRRKEGSRGAGVRDPIYLHFPDLPAEILAAGNGIVAGKLLAQISDPALMQGWSVRMRNARQQSDTTAHKRYSKWSQQAEAIFVEVGL